MKQMIIASSLIVFLAGCGQEQPTSYEVPKTEPAPAPMQNMGMGGSDADNQAVMEAHQAMMKDMQQSEFSAELPDGWSEKGASGMRMASYAIDGTSIDFYLISLSMGDVPSNVNRWRGQVGLPGAAPEDIAAQVETFEVDGHAVNYVEVYNEEGGDGIIAAIIDLAPSYWYFTAKGSVEELKAHAPEIRAFLESIKFAGHNH